MIFSLESFGIVATLAPSKQLHLLPGDALILDIDDTVMYCGLNKYKDPVRLTDAELPDRLRQLKSQGTPIVFLTARDKDYNAKTREQLAQLGLVYDDIIHAPSYSGSDGEKICTKGVMLRQYLQSLDDSRKRKFSRLLVVDNVRANLEAIDAAFTDDTPSDHTVVSYHYTPKVSLLKLPDEAVFPDDLQGYRLVRSLGGGTESTYEISNGEQCLVLKFGAHIEAMKAEILMRELYRALGVPVPATQVYSSIPFDLAKSLDVHPATVVQISEKLSPISEESEETRESKRNIEKSFFDNFIVHALIGNIDADKYDNYMTRTATPDAVVLIDAGANFLYRALGKQRREDASYVSELRTFRNESISANSARWLSGLTVDKIKDQIQKLISQRYVLDKIVWDVSHAIGMSDGERKEAIDGLTSRFNYLINGKKAAGILTLRHAEDGTVQVLLSKRVRHEWFDCFGGKADQGEDFMQAACREVKEESGGVFDYSLAEMSDSPYCDFKSYNHFGECQIYRLYFAFNNKGSDVSSFSDLEHTEYHWVSLVDLIHGITGGRVIREEDQDTVEITSGMKSIILFPPFRQLLQQEECIALLRGILDSKRLPDKSSSHDAIQRAKLISTRDHQSLIAKALVGRSSYLRELKASTSKIDEDVEITDGLVSAGVGGEISRVYRKTPSEMHLQLVLGDEYTEGELRGNIIKFVNRTYGDRYRERIIRVAYEMISKERERRDCIHFYHGCSGDVAFAYALYTAFYQVLSVDTNRFSIRADNPLLCRFKNITEFIEYFKTGDGEIDNYTDGFMQSAISANLFIFGNHTVESSHSIAYFMRNYTRKKIELSVLLNSVFEHFGIDKSLIDEALKIFNASSYRNQGFLYQFALDPESADQYAYMAGYLGHLNPLTVGDKETLKPSVVQYELLKSPESYEDYIKSLQARLMISPKVKPCVTQMAWKDSSEEGLARDKVHINSLADRMAMRFLEGYVLRTKLNADEALVKIIKTQLSLDGFKVRPSPNYIYALIKTHKFEELFWMISRFPEITQWTIGTGIVRYSSRMHASEEVGKSFVLALFESDAPDYVIRAIPLGSYKGQIQMLDIDKLIKVIGLDDFISVLQNETISTVIRIIIYNLADEQKNAGFEALQNMIEIDPDIITNYKHKCVKVSRLALEFGHVEIIRTLLKAGFDVNARYEDGKTMLHIAADNGQIKIVEVLLGASGTDTNARDNSDNTALIYAAASGHLDIVRALLSAGADFDICGAINMTALIYAAMYKDTEIVRALLTAGANANASSDCFGSALIAAATRGNLEIVTLLLESDVDIDAKHNDKTALHIAAEKGYTEIVRALLKAHANLDAVDKYGDTALHRAAAMGHIEIVNDLLSAGANVKAMTLNIATQSGKVEIARALLKAGAKVNAVDKDGNTALHGAAAMGHIEIVNELLGAGANVNAITRYGITTLYSATQSGKVEIVRALLGRGAGINVNVTDTKGEAALHRAVQMGHIEIVNDLLDAGANVNAIKQNGDSALYMAVKNGHLEIVEALLTAGATVNAIYENGGTALYMAVKNGHLKIVEALLKAGADFEFKSKYKSIRFIHTAAAYGYTEIVKILVEYGADVGAITTDHQTVLSFAAHSGKSEVIKYVLTLGADVNAKDQFGDTAIHRATRTGSEEAVKALLEAGADINAINIHGETALHIAVSLNCLPIVKSLLNAGADCSLKNSDGFTALDIIKRANTYFRDDMLRIFQDKNAEMADYSGPRF